MKFAPNQIVIKRVIRNIEDGETWVVLGWTGTGGQKGSFTGRFGDIADAKSLGQLSNGGLYAKL